MVSRFDSMFEAAAAPMLDAEFSESVVFVRGGQESSAFDCAFSLVTDEVFGDEGPATAAERRTWWPKKASVVLGSTAVEPRAGDVLRSGSTQHEILPDEGRPAVENHPGGARWVVRTKRIT